MREIIAKSEFAALIKVSRSRISQIIKNGKIYGDALVGTGQHARIRVSIATAQLRNSVDGTVGNARLKLDGLSVDPNGDNQAGGVDTTIDTGIKKQRLEQLSLSNDRARIEAAARNGRYTNAEDAKQQMGRITSQMLNIFEGWLGQLALKLATHFGLAQRDVLHVLRSEFRLFRATASAALRREAEHLPILVEEDHLISGDEATTPTAAPADPVEHERESDDGD